MEIVNGIPMMALLEAHCLQLLYSWENIEHSNSYDSLRVVECEPIRNATTTTISVGYKLCVRTEDLVNSGEDILSHLLFRMPSGAGGSIDGLGAVSIPSLKTLYQHLKEMLPELKLTYPGRSGTRSGHCGGISFTNSLKISEF